MRKKPPAARLIADRWLGVGGRHAMADGVSVRNKTVTSAAHTNLAPGNPERGNRRSIWPIFLMASANDPARARHNHDGGSH